MILAKLLIIQLSNTEQYTMPLLGSQWLTLRRVQFKLSRVDEGDDYTKDHVIQQDGNHDR